MKEPIKNDENLLKKLFVILQKTDNAIMMLDSAGNFEWINEGFTRMYGYTREQFLSELGRNIRKTSFNPKINESLDQCINKKETVIYNCPNITRDNKSIWTQTTLTPILDSQGNLENIVAIDSDISALKEANKKITQQKEQIQEQADQLEIINKHLEKLSIVADKTDNAVVIMDSKGNFEWANNAFTRIYGYSFEEFVEKKGKSIFEINNAPKTLDLIDECLNKKKTVVYRYLNKENGLDHWTQTTLTPILDDKNNIVKLVAIDSDVNELKQAKQEIEKQHHEIITQKDELVRLNRTKDMFFSIIAHDLKNPMNSIIGFSEILTSEFDDLDDFEKKEFIKYINESAISLQNLIDNLLQWARAQTDKIRFSPSKNDLYFIIEDNIKLLRGNAERKAIDIYSRIPKKTMVWCDKNMVSTIIRNLLSNAIKFTNDYGKIKIISKKLDDKLEITVKDNGIGMSAGVKERLFKEIGFSTFGTANESGTGLGLILCQQFVKKHNGDLKIESQQNIGTKISFTLPLDP